MLALVDRLHINNGHIFDGVRPYPESSSESRSAYKINTVDVKVNTAVAVGGCVREELDGRVCWLIGMRVQL